MEKILCSPVYNAMVQEIESNMVVNEAKIDEI